MLDDDSRLNLANASSGLQSIIPMWVYLDYLFRKQYSPNEMSSTKSESEDIKSFHLQNTNGIEVLAVNFEQNKGFFPDGVCDCECFFRPKDVGKGWVLLCELKYCKEENIAVNPRSAYEQLMDTFQHCATF